MSNPWHKTAPQQHAERWRQRVLHQPFGFPQDPNVDGLARWQGSGFDEQDTCSAASGYAFVFFVSFRTEKNLLGTLLSWGSLPPEMKEKASLGHVDVPMVFAESCKQQETGSSTLNTSYCFSV